MALRPLWTALRRPSLDSDEPRAVLFPEQASARDPMPAPSGVFHAGPADVTQKVSELHSVRPCRDRRLPATTLSVEEAIGVAPAPQSPKSGARRWEARAG